MVYRLSIMGMQGCKAPTVGVKNNMKTQNVSPRFIIGLDTANGLTGFYDGDLFQKGRELFRLVSGQYGWTLRHANPQDGRADYSQPPLAGWIDVSSAIELACKLNEAEAQDQCPICSGHHPKFCCAKDGHGG
jgi:hypothetical protein